MSNQKYKISRIDDGQVVMTGNWREVGEYLDDQNLHNMFIVYETETTSLVRSTPTARSSVPETQYRITQEVDAG